MTLRTPHEIADPPAPVIVEELTGGMNGDIPYGKWQFAIWSLAGVMRAIGRPA